MSDDKNFWYLYLLRCADGSIYTGISNDVDARVREHNQGKGAKYTAQRRPVFLIYQEQHPDQSSVRRREEQIKRWGKKKKENLALGFPQLHLG
jgi:putative endonuclease